MASIKQIQLNGVDYNLVDTDTLTALNNHIGNAIKYNYYGVCSTAAGTVAKTVTVDSSFKLVTGVSVTVKFSDKNSASNPTLNVNGTGAKPLYRYGTTVVSTSTTSSGWIAGSVQTFTYDGAGWVRDYWNNTTYSNGSLGQGYGVCSTAAATAEKTASISSYALTVGGIVTIKFTYDVPASATLNITSKGAKPIYYKGSAIIKDIIKAGDIATFIYETTTASTGVYTLLGIDRNYSSEIDNLKTQLNDLSTDVNHFLNVDDTTKDELSEVLALIDENKDVIESITSSKVNKTDIVNNLTTADATKVLSANQGVEIKKLIDNLQTNHNDDITELEEKIPTKVSELENDEGYITEYTDTQYILKADSTDSATVSLESTVSTLADVPIDGTGSDYSVTGTFKGIYLQGPDSKEYLVPKIRLQDFTSNGGNTQIKQVEGVLGIVNGGTGASTAAEALQRLGLTATAKELNYCDGVTSNIQTQLNSKQATINLTTNRALISNSSGSIGVSATTANELAYLSGATSNIQNQLNDLNTSKVNYIDELIINCGTSTTNIFN